MKPSARALAVLGFRIDILSRSPRGPERLNTCLHSDCSGNGGRAERGTSFGLEVEVEYGREPVCRMWATRVDETDVGLKPERGARFSDDLETRDAENIALLDLALRVGDGMTDGTSEFVLGWRS